MLKFFAAATLLAVSTPAFAMGWFHRGGERSVEIARPDGLRHGTIDGHDLLHKQINHLQMLDMNNLNNPLSPLSPLNPLSPMNPLNQMNLANRMGRF